MSFALNFYRKIHSLKIKIHWADCLSLFLIVSFPSKDIGTIPIVPWS